MKFYSVKKKAQVEIEDSKCVKSKSVGKGGKCSYMVKAVDAEGNKLTTFVAEAVWKTMKCREA